MKTHVWLLLGLSLSLFGCEKSYGFDELAVGEVEQARTPVALDNRQFVRAVYSDLLRRSPEVFDFVITDATGAEVLRFPVDEEASLVAALDAVGDPASLRASILAGLLRSTEVDFPEKKDVEDPEALIVDQFRAYLGRDPNAYELQAFAEAWRTDPAVTPRTIVRALVGSREYQSR